MHPDYARSPLQKVVIPAASSAGIQRGNNSTQLLSIYNCSINPQQYAISIYDAPSVQAVINGGFSPIYQPILSAGQIIDMTTQNRGFKLDFGLVAIPVGVANNDGGWMLVYA